MKRHPSLIPLSRFHRSALFLAFVCKRNAPEVKGYPTDSNGKKDYAVKFFKEQLNDHFQLEEEALFPIVAAKSTELSQLADELVLEHYQLRQLFNSLETEPRDSPETLFEMAELLEKHIRKEERQFFQLIQQTLSESELESLTGLF